MKKLLFFAALGLALAGCKIVDYSCSRYFNVANQTGYAITVIIKTGAVESVPTGSERTIYKSYGHCDKNTIPDDPFPDEEIMHITDSSDMTVQIQVNGRVVSEEIFKRKYWNFSNEAYRATYTLLITNELIESLKQAENPGSTLETRASSTYQINPDDPYSLSNVQRDLNLVSGSSAPTLQATMFRDGAIWFKSK